MGARRLRCTRWHSVTAAIGSVCCRPQSRVVCSLACSCIAVLAALSHGAESLSVCGSEKGTLESGCWQPLEGKSNCHVWNPSPKPEESAVFDGWSRCRDGMLSGTGTLTWQVIDEGETRISTLTGHYLQGRENGQFVVTDSSNWARSEGNYVEGKRQGLWLHTNPPGTEGVWDRMESYFVDGEQRNVILVDFKEVDGEFRETEREEGPVVHRKRHGDWSSTGAEYKVRKRYANGQLHGPYVKEFVDGRRLTGEYAEGEPAGRWVELDSSEAVVEERNYLQGQLHGEFNSVYGEGYSTDHRVAGSFLHGLRDGTWVANFDEGHWSEETYVAGMKHGAEVKKHADGFRREGSFSNGRRTGKWSLRNGANDVLVKATFSDDEVQELVLPGAAIPSSTPPAGRAPIDGAFGLLFGPDGVDQVKRLECDGGQSCLAVIADKLLWTSPGEKEPNDSDYWWPEPSAWVWGLGRSAYLRIHQPPRPVAGGRNYRVSVSPEHGLVSISTDIGEFPTEDSCEAEEQRLQDLLESKYGRCTDYRFEDWQVGFIPIGQCDDRGLPEREISAFCAEETEFVDGEERTKHHYVALSYEVLLKEERVTILNAWLERGQVDAADL